MGCGEKKSTKTREKRITTQPPTAPFLFFCAQILDDTSCNADLFPFFVHSIRNMTIVTPPTLSHGQILDVLQRVWSKVSSESIAPFVHRNELTGLALTLIGQMFCVCMRLVQRMRIARVHACAFATPSVEVTEATDEIIAMFVRENIAFIELCKEYNTPPHSIQELQCTLCMCDCVREVDARKRACQLDDFLSDVHVSRTGHVDLHIPFSFLERATDTIERYIPRPEMFELVFNDRVPLTMEVAREYLRIIRFLAQHSFNMVVTRTHIQRTEALAKTISECRLDEITNADSDLNQQIRDVSEGESPCVLAHVVESTRRWCALDNRMVDIAQIAKARYDAASAAVSRCSK